MGQEKEIAMVLKGHDEGLKFALSLLEEFSLPTGLLPIADVIEVGYVKNTGYFWIIQKNKLQHYFKTIGRQVAYDKEITGYIEDECIEKLKGVKAKEMLMWMPVYEILTYNDESNGDGKVQFTSIGGMGMTFPTEAFQIGK